MRTTRGTLFETQYRYRPVLILFSQGGGCLRVDLAKFVFKGIYMETILFCLRLLLDVDARLRKHTNRRGELVTLIVLILTTIDLESVPVLELRSDLEDLVATTVKLPAALHERLKSIANSRHSSMNALMNSAIWAYTEEKSTKEHPRLSRSPLNPRVGASSTFVQ